MEDTRLLQRALQGDPTAFGSLYDRNAAAVFGYAYRMLGNRTDAEDVTQDVFLALARRGGSYDPTRSFKTWLLTLARNASIDHRRRRRCRPAAPIDRDILESAVAVTQERDDTELLERALPQIPDVYREALWLCDAMGLSYQEASQLMECDAGTIGSRISRGRQLLRDLFKRNGHVV